MLSLFEFFARELDSYFLFTYIVNVYKSIHRHPDVVFTHLRNLHDQKLSSHYVPTSKAIGTINSWLIAYPKLSAKISRAIISSEQYPATTIPFLRPILRDNLFILEYNQSKITIIAPPNLIKNIHSYVNNSIWLAHLQFICSLRAQMAADRRDMMRANYYAIDGPFFKAHPDLLDLLNEFRIGQPVSISKMWS